MSNIRLRSLERVALFAAAGLALYANALDSPFIYDDIPAIVENDDIRQLWPPGWFEPRRGSNAAVNARPVVSLSLAVNYAFAELDPRPYRLFNLALHIGNVLLLYGVVRRTLHRDQPDLPAGRLSVACAGLWLVHPLGSQCVNYVIQRTELLMATFYLATLYGGIRSMEGASRWCVAAVVFCALGMASKEVMVSAPLILLCYDRTFVAGTFAAAWRRRRGMYCGLAATWGVLVLLQSSGPHGDTVGSVWSGAGWNYALNQPEMVLRYLYLAFWPHPLILDYGFPGDLALSDVWVFMAPVLAMAGLVVYAFFRRHPWGFTGVWYVAVLLPTTSIVPLLNEVGAERRVYLGMAALIPAVVVGGYGLLPKRGAGIWGTAIVAIASLSCGYLTFQRNHDYQSDRSIWRSVVESRPDNPRGHNNYGKALYEAGKLVGALAHYRRAIELKPYYPEAWGNLGLALFHQGDHVGALRAYGQALAQESRLAETWYNLGVAHHHNGDLRQALQAYNQAAELRPGDVEAWYNMGMAHRKNLNSAGAVVALTKVTKLAPDFADGWFQLGRVLRDLGEMADAAAAFEMVLVLRPGDNGALKALGMLR